ncbi:MAG: Trk family potassium uptake protein [Oscillospiraceae bacterium]|nr:Trk family potassium uptake protein [Oscillospiraceae bacterium]
MKRWYKRLRPFKRHKAKLSSVQIIALGFFIMILVGTGLLMLPWATQIPGGASFGDALFTATSASCVTGLVLQDTGTYWSTFGQVVIICLIQIGGLGFMTIATLFLLLLRRRLGLREREVMVSSVSYGRLGGLSAFVRQIFLGTLLAEGVGAALLSMRFVQDFGWGRGIYYGVWHAVSAFCNGGFDLMGPHSGPFSSFTTYAGDPLVSLTLCALILVGGAGFLVWDDLLRCRHHWRRYRLQTKVVLFVNLVLVAGGAVLFLLLERENLGAGKSLGRQALEAVFDAVTPRTAGFNTTDTASLSAGSTLLTIILMVVGGGPGSTAGGVKVTTVAVLFVHTVAGIRREQSANAFGRSIGDSALKQATSVLFTNVALALAGAVVISLVQSLPLAELLFETFSAIGTVGMSTGLTRSLAPFSQAVVIFLMYCGRVGSISFAVALLEKKALPPVTLPQEDLVIG